MKKILLLVLAAAMIVCLPGCGVVTDFKNAVEEIVSPEATDAPESGENPVIINNSINLGVCDFDTFNPLKTESQTMRDCMQLVYEPLFELDQQMRIVPVLAKDYSVSPDGRQVTVNLKEGVLWHDGSTLDAYDVAYTMRRIRQGDTTYTNALSVVSEHKAVSDYSVQINLRYSLPNFVALLTFPIVKYQTDMTVNDKYSPVGTGPFIFDGMITSNRFRMSAFEEYRDGRAQLDNVYIERIPDADKYRSMFEASEFDVMTSEMVDLTKYMPRGNVNVYDFVSNKLTFLGFNMQNSLFAGNETRVGLAEYINKEEIVSSIIYSHGVATNIPINPSSYLYYDTNTDFTGNISEGEPHLGNDGWGTNEDGHYVRTKNGARETLRFRILTNKDSEEKVSIAKKIAEYFTRNGISVTVDTEPYEQYMALINAKNYDAFIGEVELGSNLDLSPLVTSSGNYFGYGNVTVDTIIGQLGMTQNEDEQRELFRQLGDIMLTDMPFVPIFYRKGSVLAGASIKSGISPSVSGFYRNSLWWSKQG